jgi:PAS domain S-box-containing protein
MKSNDILNVIESEGIIWVITNKGFAWFDDYKWHHIQDTITKYIKNPYSLHKYPNLLAGNKGDLVAVFNGGLTFISKYGINNVKYEHNGKNLYIYDIVRYNQSYLLLASEQGAISKNIYLLNGKTVSNFSTPKELSKVDSIFELNFINGSDGSVWINSSKGIFYLLQDKWIRILRSELNSIYEISTPLLGHNGKYSFYIAFPTEKSGLWSFEPNSKPKLIDSLQILLLTSDVNPDGIIFNLFHGGKLECLINNDWTEIIHLPLIMKNATKIKFTKNGDLWVCHFNKLYLCKLSSNRWDYWIHKDTYKRQFINDIVKDRDSSFWVAYGDGVGNIKNGKLIQFTRQIGNLKLEGVTAINIDKNDNIWIGSGGGYFENTYKWDGTTWEHINLIPNQMVQIHKIKKDRKGRLWFLTLSNISKEKGLGALVYDNDKVIEVWDSSKGLLSNRIYDFLEDKQGNYWFATYFGLSKFKNGKWKHWNTKNGLRADLIFSLALHPDGKTVYYANPSTGVGYIKDDQPSFIPQLDSLNILQVLTLEFEKNGNLWLGTKTGIYCLVDNAVISFSHEQGLTSNFIWPILIDDKSILIGTFGAGINKLNLDERKLPAPVIDFFVKSNNNDINSIELKIHTYRGFTKPSDYSIRYRFDNSNWSHWQITNNIDLLNLSSGNHSLEVQVMNLLGNKYENIYKYNFNIESAFYEKTEFLLPIGFLLIVIFSGSLYYHRKIKLQIKQLEASQKELSDSELKYRHIIENTSDALIVTQNNLIKFCNDVFSNMTGFSKQEIINHSIYELFNFDNKELVKEIIDELFESGKSTDILDTIIHTKTMESIWVEIRMNVIPNPEGHESVIMFSDIDKRKKLEMKMLDALQKEKELGDLKSSIIATISHEYRTPLTIMQTSTDLLRIYYRQKNDEKFNKGIIRINDAIARMIKFLEDIVLLGKIESRNIDLRFDKTDVMQFFNDIISNIKDKNYKNHIINVEYKVKSKNIYLETTLMIEIISRLLSNAINYSPDGSEINLNVGYEDNELSVTINDNGSGIEKDKLNKIFEPFNRVVNSEAQSGTGFGLTIVKGCIEALNGKIKIDSKPNLGTQVEFVIPVKEKNG